jgi:anti-sigma-K factor RskA
MNPIDRDVLLEYVMGGLTPEREKEVAAYLRQNPTDAAWVRDMFETVANVALSQEPISIPANSANDLLKRIRKESEVKARPAPLIQPKPRPTPWAFLGMGLGVALALVLWFGGGKTTFENYQIAQQLKTICAESSCQELVDENNNDLGTLVRNADNTLLVVFNNNPPKGQVYQGWEIAESGPASLGVYEGRIMRITQPLTIGNTFGVTLEPPGGSPQPTTAPIVVYTLSS